MNNVILVGNLTRDPEIKNGEQESKTICRFTLAIDDSYGDNKKTSFIPIVVFGRQAINCMKYLSKGRKVCVQGRIQTGSYEKDGRKVYTTDVIASTVEFLSKNDTSTGNEENVGEKSSFSPTGGFAQLEYDDIPF